MKQFIYTHRASDRYLKVNDIEKYYYIRCLLDSLSCQLKSQFNTEDYQIINEELFTSGDPDDMGRPLEKYNEICFVVKGTLEEKI